MILSYGRYGNFGALTRVPGVPKITVFLKIEKDRREYGLVTTPYYDDTLPPDTAEARWGAVKYGTPAVAMAFAPGLPVPATITLTFPVMPKEGEVSRYTRPPGAAMPRSAAAPAPAPEAVSAPGPAPTPEPVPAPAPVPEIIPPPAPIPIPSIMPTGAPAPGAIPAPTLRIPAPAPAPAPTEVPVKQATDTGQVATVDMPGVGPTALPVYVAPIAKPEIVPGPEGKPVVVVPPEQLPNLPTRPAREAVGPRGPEEVVQFSQEIWDLYFTFPLRRRLEMETDPARKAAQAARGSAEEVDPFTELILTSAGIFDMEGRRYPETRALRTLPTASPSASGLMPTAKGRPTAVDASVQTTGTILEHVPGVVATPGITPASNGKPAAGVAIVPVAAGAGVGFLVAGPLGAAVGAGLLFFLGRK